MTQPLVTYGNIYSSWQGIAIATSQIWKYPQLVVGQCHSHQLHMEISTARGRAMPQPLVKYGNIHSWWQGNAIATSYIWKYLQLVVGQCHSHQSNMEISTAGGRSMPQPLVTYGNIHSSWQGNVIATSHIWKYPQLTQCGNVIATSQILKYPHLTQNGMAMS